MLAVRVHALRARRSGIEHAVIHNQAWNAYVTQLVQHSTIVLYAKL